MKKCFNKSITKVFKNQSGIYIIYIAHHTYVGSSKCIYTRMQTHRKQLRANKRENKKFINAYNKYGESQIYWDILELCDPSDLLIREKWWIEHLHPDLNINLDPTIIPTNIIFNCTKSSKKVYQYDLQGNFIKEYDSVQEAGRQNPVIDTRSISLVAAKSKTFYKSAGGYQWSYVKYNKLPKYTNNSDKAKIISIYIFDILKGIEIKFNSITEAVRTLFPNYDNFDSMCAIISSCAKKSGIIQNQFLAHYENSTYKIPNRNIAIIDNINHRIYKDAKEAEKFLKISTFKIKKKCKDPLNNSLQYITTCARVKLRESGKLLEKGQP